MTLKGVADCRADKQWLQGQIIPALTTSYQSLMR